MRNFLNVEQVEGSLMTDLEHLRETALSYIQFDAFERSDRFPSLCRALKGLVSAGNAAEAARFAALAVCPSLSSASLLSLGRILERHAPTTNRPPLRVAVLGGATTIQLIQLLKLFLAAESIPVEIYEGDYGAFRQEILAPSGALDAFRPQVIFLATSFRDVASRTNDGKSAHAVNDEYEAWSRLWESANQRWGATLIQNLFESPPWSPMGHYSSRHKASEYAYLDDLNRMFAERAPRHVLLHDLRQLVAEAGSAHWFDTRFYFEAKMPCGPECLVSYAHSVASLVRALVGRSKKVLALDLDNTLWGGMVGDLGPGGVIVGQGSGEAEAFLAFQQYVRSMKDRGILLAVCSKNDPEVAREPFLERRDMLLRLDDFACFVANWNDKARNLREIAAQLELGLDSIVFVDDNPAERALVRRFAPEVATPDMPQDPAGYIAALARHRYFEPISFTHEDSRRAEYYLQNARRKELATTTADLDAFLASLDMTATVEPVNALNIERVTQLVNKSNQYNLTTRRYTSAEIQNVISDPDWCTITISLRDKLGDNGLISIVFLRRGPGDTIIDTWLMSCRVLQRGVEYFALEQIVRHAASAGSAGVRGVYIPTAKNAMVEDHYARLGFSEDGRDGETTYWTLRLADYRPTSTHIREERSA